MRYKTLLLWGITFFLMGLVGCQTKGAFECTDTLGCITIAPDAPLKIAVLQVISGELGEALGWERVHSVEIAVDDWHNQFMGHPIELQIEDSLCSKEGGTVASIKVTADTQIVGIIGTTCSGAAVPAAEIMSNAGFVMISSSNTAPSLTSVNGEPGADWQKGYFRTAPNDTVQGRVAATFAFDTLGLRKVATVNDGDTYTRSLTEVFAQVFKELGGEVVLERTINKGDKDMKPILEAVVQAEAELVFFPIFTPESNAIIKQAQDIPNFEDIVLMSADASLVASVIEDVGAAGKGLHFTKLNIPESEGFDKFVSNYQKKFDETPTSSYYLHTYDATNLLLSTLETIAKQDDDGTLHIGRQALRDALYATQGFEGLTGKLSCDAFGDCGVARFNIIRFDDPAAGFEGLSHNVIYTYKPEE